MHQTAQSTFSDDIDIAALLRAISRRKYWILMLAISAGIATFVGLSFVTPYYTSEARILIEREDNSYKRPADSENGNSQRVSTDQETVASQVQVLQSRDLALGVTEALGLDQNPEFNKDAGTGVLFKNLLRKLGLQQAPTKVAMQERVVDAFLERLEVYQLQKSRVIAVSFQSRDPETAARAANKLSELYLTWQQGEKLKQTKEASTWLSAQIKELTKKVEAADTAAEKFRSSSGLFEGSNNTTLDAQQLSELNSQLILAKAQRTEAEARAALIQKMLKDKGDVDSAADVIKSRFIQRLLEQRVRVQRELAELSATLLPSHPRIQQLKSELSDVRKQIRQEARKVVSSLQNEAQIAGAREASLRESLAEMKQSTAKGNENQIKLRALEREAKANRELLESYLARYRDASARSEQGSVPTHASIVSRAHVSNTPSFPQKGPISLLAMAAVALLSLAHTVARELILSQHSYPAQGGYVHPEVSSQPAGGVLRTHSIRNLVKQLRLARTRRVHVTPTTEKSEASSQAIDIARQLASAGEPTILVDAMSHGDHVAIALDLPDAAGLHQVLSAEASFEEVVRRDPDSALHVISGTTEPGRIYGLDIEGFVPVLEALEMAYSHVVIYAGPSQTRNLLAREANGRPALVLTAGADDREEEIAWAAENCLSASKVPVHAIILEESAAPFASLTQLPFLKKAEAV